MSANSRFFHGLHQEDPDPTKAENPTLFSETLDYLSTRFGTPRRGVSSDQSKGAVSSLSGLSFELCPDDEPDEEIELREASPIPVPSPIPTCPPVVKHTAMLSRSRRSQMKGEHPTEFVGEMVQDFFELPRPLIDHFISAVDDDPEDHAEKEGGATWQFCKALNAYKRKREETTADWLCEDDFYDEYREFRAEMKGRKLSGDLIPLWMSMRMSALKNICFAHHSYRMSKQLQNAFLQQEEQNHWDREYIRTLEKELDEYEKRESLRLSSVQIRDDSPSADDTHDLEATQKLPEFNSVHDVPAGLTVFEDGSVFHSTSNGMNLVGVVRKDKKESTNPLKIRRILTWSSKEVKKT